MGEQKNPIRSFVVATAWSDILRYSPDTDLRQAFSYVSIWEPNPYTWST